MGSKSPMETGITILNFSAGDLLDIQRNNNTDAAIKSAVEANLAAQILVGAEGGTLMIIEYQLMNLSLIMPAVFLLLRI